jgi:hypothetical protein
VPEKQNDRRISAPNAIGIGFQKGAPKINRVGEIWGTGQLPVNVFRAQKRAHMTGSSEQANDAQVFGNSGTSECQGEIQAKKGEKKE